MADLILVKKDETYLQIFCNDGIAQEISDEFAFEVPGAKYMKKVKKKLWDGIIRLFNKKTRCIYLGLLPRILHFAQNNGYSVENHVRAHPTNFNREAYHNFLLSLKTPFIPEVHQYKSVEFAIKKNRGVIVSPTGSGKSFIAYLIAKHFNTKTLLIVPKTSLVVQTKDNFINYGMRPDDIHTIYEGRPKISRKPMVISTWQSIYEEPEEIFYKYNLIIGDEAHHFQAKSLVKIMEKMRHCHRRIGLTGTLDNMEMHRYVIEGLFGPVYVAAKTKELIDKENLTQLKINIINLQHSHPTDTKDYQNHIEWTVSSKRRNNFIANLAVDQTENVLVLYQFVEKHGKIIHDLIKEKAKDRKVYIIHGKIETDNRERIRHIMDKEKNVIVVASYGTYSTGIDIPSLSRIIFAFSMKSKIRTLQSIGRGLRQSANKENCILYDIADNTFFGKRHLTERKLIYDAEHFNYKEFNIPI